MGWHRKLIIVSSKKTRKKGRRFVDDVVADEKTTAKKQRDLSYLPSPGGTTSSAIAYPKNDTVGVAGITIFAIDLLGRNYPNFKL